jgi:hypothetical protein
MTLSSWRAAHQDVGALGQFVLGDGRKEARRWPAFAISRFSELRPESFDLGRAQLVQHDAETGLVDGICSLHAVSPIHAVGATTRRLTQIDAEALPALFYECSFEDHVPQDHLLPSIDRFVDLSGIRADLADLHGHTGRPSIDPERLIRMLLIGYC